MGTKDILILVLLIVVIIAGVLALVFLRGDKTDLPPAGLSDDDLSNDSPEAVNQALDSIPDVDLNSEFQAVDQDINQL